MKPTALFLTVVGVLLLAAFAWAYFFRPAPGPPVGLLTVAQQKEIKAELGRDTFAARRAMAHADSLLYYASPAHVLPPLLPANSTYADSLRFYRELFADPRKVDAESSRP